MITDWMSHTHTHTHGSKTPCWHSERLQGQPRDARRDATRPCCHRIAHLKGDAPAPVRHLKPNKLTHFFCDVSIEYTEPFSVGPIWHRHRTDAPFFFGSFSSSVCSRIVCASRCNAQVQHMRHTHTEPTERNIKQCVRGLTEIARAPSSSNGALHDELLVGGATISCSEMAFLPGRMHFFVLLDSNALVLLQPSPPLTSQTCVTTHFFQTTNDGRVRAHVRRACKWVTPAPKPAINTTHQRHTKLTVEPRKLCFFFQRVDAHMLGPTCGHATMQRREHAHLHFGIFVSVRARAVKRIQARDIHPARRLLTCGGALEVRARADIACCAVDFRWVGLRRRRPVAFPSRHHARVCVCVSVFL